MNVLYEDNHLLGVFKPAGQLTQGDSSGDTSLLDEAKLWLKEKYGKPGNVYLGLVHRLDRRVSGVMVFAKTSKAASRLSEAFRSREVDKRYLAIVEGVVGPDSGRREDSLLWDETAGKAVVAAAGKRSALSYVVLERRENMTLLQILLETGRKHQIRAQLAALGHPILGDHRYGAKTMTGELALCSTRLVFPHPTKAGEQVIIESEMPDFFSMRLAQ